MNDLGSCTPAIDGPRSLSRIGTDEKLDHIRGWISRQRAATNVAASDVIFSHPEEKKAQAGCHGVVKLHVHMQGGSHQFCGVLYGRLNVLWHRGLWRGGGL